jgi:hypothetical protein
MRPHDLQNREVWRAPEQAVTVVPAPVSTFQPGRPPILARLLAALHMSRERNAARAIARHWHLVEEARAHETRRRDQTLTRGLPTGASAPWWRNRFNERSGSCRVR